MNRAFPVLIVTERFQWQGKEDRLSGVDLLAWSIKAITPERFARVSATKKSIIIKVDDGDVKLVHFGGPLMVHN